jgi:hypothetical protein
MWTLVLNICGSSTGMGEEHIGCVAIRLDRSPPEQALKRLSLHSHFSAINHAIQWPSWREICKRAYKKQSFFTQSRQSLSDLSIVAGHPEWSRWSTSDVVHCLPIIVSFCNEVQILRTSIKPVHRGSESARSRSECEVKRQIQTQQFG